MSKKLTVYHPGSFVSLMCPDGKSVPAAINQICVAGGSLNVTYQVTYWNGGSRNTEWVQADEIGQDSEAATATIGFKP